jgi:hypothetical protein
MPALSLRHHALRERLLALLVGYFEIVKRNECTNSSSCRRVGIASNDRLDQPQLPLGAPFRAIRPIAA